MRQIIKTEKQALANRKNALKSTGPVTEQGKEVVRWNALKHGLLSKAVVITNGDGKEDPEQFKQLFETLVEQYQPLGAIEEMLVEQITVAYWRKRRVLAAESGEIQKHVSTCLEDWWNGFYEEIVRYEDKMNLERIEFAAKNGCAKPRSGELYLVCLTNPQGVTYLERILQETHTRIAESKELGALKEQIANVFPLSDVYNAIVLGHGSKAHKLKVIQDKLAEVKKTAQKLAVRIKLQQEYIPKALMVPSGEVVEKLLRYEGSLDRQLYRAIRELRQLQELRLDRMPGDGKTENYETKPKQPIFSASR